MRICSSSGRRKYRLETRKAPGPGLSCSRILSRFRRCPTMRLEPRHYQDTCKRVPHRADITGKGNRESAGAMVRHRGTVQLIFTMSVFFTWRGRLVSAVAVQQRIGRGSSTQHIERAAKKGVGCGSPPARCLPLASFCLYPAREQSGKGKKDNW